MKLMEIPYKRPDVDALIEKCAKLTADFANAESAAEQIRIFKEFEEVKGHFSTYMYVRYRNGRTQRT